MLPGVPGFSPGGGSVAWPPMPDTPSDRPLPPFLRACRGIPGGPDDRVPVWFMRQAGRSLPEYKAIRGSGTHPRRHPRLPSCRPRSPSSRCAATGSTPPSSTPTSSCPVAAIGFGVDVAPASARSSSSLRSSGPRTSQRLRPLDPEADTPYVLETVRILAEELPVPLIGFAGAPFTVASYLVEGRPSRTYAKTKALMFGDPGAVAPADASASPTSPSPRCARRSTDGASALQLFDSWAGALAPPDYERFVLPHSRQGASTAVADLDVPRIHFGVGTGELLAADGRGGRRRASASTGGSPLDDARSAPVAADVALQGNLDPALVVAPMGGRRREAVRDVLRRNGGHPGHIFNLGHGVLPETDPDVLLHIVELVHAHSTGHGRIDSHGRIAGMSHARSSRSSAAASPDWSPRSTSTAPGGTSPCTKRAIASAARSGRRRSATAWSTPDPTPSSPGSRRGASCARNSASPISSPARSAPVPAYFHRDGELHALPTGTVLGVPTDLDALAGERARLARGCGSGPHSTSNCDATPIDGDISVGAYFRARLGDEVTGRLDRPHDRRHQRLRHRSTQPRVGLTPDRSGRGGQSPVDHRGTPRRPGRRRCHARLTEVGPGGTTEPVFYGLPGGIASDDRRSRRRPSTRPRST